MTTAKDQHAQHSTAAPDVGIGHQETMKIHAGALAGKIKDLLHEGNVRRIVVKNDQGHTVMEIPVNAGVIAAAALPIVTAVGALAALANDWKIQILRDESDLAPETASTTSTNASTAPAVSPVDTRVTVPVADAAVTR
ncbi:MAG: DUF4342 domain-containing protein [Actinomycetota bacterium]|nr:DUF4342 domain-containing protein [Actinomycetota bacterium]